MIHLMNFGKKSATLDFREMAILNTVPHKTCNHSNVKPNDQLLLVTKLAHNGNRVYIRNVIYLRRSKS